ncbi:uncharacterized protein LODBEIA_P48410 [Lodderomyces beijingensis]|uniref:Cyclin N-terminal domain-containing protein n=1 Tax=Lodderomyces beijingensis TaxID=1775926 RepID=A0ABP0ZR65_9ASCO
MDQFYINGYIKLLWILISNTRKSPASSTSHRLFTQFNTRYGKFIQQLINNSQVSSTNLMISLYYLYKYYYKNSILSHSVCEETDGETAETLTSSTIIYMILASLILSNKCYDDQSYTLKTWWIIIDTTNKQMPTVELDLKLLNSIESYFLASLNFKLSFIEMSQDVQFWSMIECDSLFRFNRSILNKFKALVNVGSGQDDDKTSRQQQHQNCYSPWQGVGAVQEATNLNITPPLLCPAASPVPSATTTFSSPLDYPLTPHTPFSHSHEDYGSNKKRRTNNSLLSNPVRVLPPQMCITPVNMPPPPQANYKPTSAAPPTAYYNGNLPCTQPCCQPHSHSQNFAVPPATLHQQYLAPTLPPLQSSHLYTKHNTTTYSTAIQQPYLHYQAPAPLPQVHSVAVNPYTCQPYFVYW